MWHLHFGKWRDVLGRCVDATSGGWWIGGSWREPSSYIADEDRYMGLGIPRLPVSYSFLPSFHFPTPTRFDQRLVCTQASRHRSQLSICREARLIVLTPGFTTRYFLHGFRLPLYPYCLSCHRCAPILSSSSLARVAMQIVLFFFVVPHCGFVPTHRLFPRVVIVQTVLYNLIPLPDNLTRTLNIEVLSFAKGEKEAVEDNKVARSTVNVSCSILKYDVGPIRLVRVTGSRQTRWVRRGLGGAVVFREGVCLPQLDQRGANTPGGG